MNYRSANLTPSTSSVHESMVGNSVLFAIGDDNEIGDIVGDSGAEEEGPLLSENLDDDEQSEGDSENQLGNNDFEDDGEIVGCIGDEEEGPLLVEDLGEDELGNSESKDDGTWKS